MKRKGSDKDANKRTRGYESFYLKTAIDSILKNNSIHGPDLIFGADNIFMTILYILLTLFFLAYCTYQITNTILTYLSYEIVTTTEVRTEAPAQFPVVAFCNINPFDENYAYGIIFQILSAATTMIPSNYATTNEYSETVQDYYKFNFLSKFLNSTAQLGLDYGWQINQMLVSCRFQGEMCSQEDFMFVYDFYYSSCFRFNQGKMMNGTDHDIKYIGKPGWRNGLQLELYAGLVIQQELYVPSRGFRISVFNQSNPYQILDETGINVAPGMLTNVAIDRIFINHLKAPYGNCLDNDITKIDWTQTDALQFMYSNFIQGNDVYYTGNFDWAWTLTYSQSLCVKLCYQKYLWETCRCYDITLPKSIAVVQVYSVNACVNLTQLNCMKDAQDMFYSNKTLFEPCYTQCPIECNEIKYKYKTSVASYPTSYYADLLINNQAFNDVINAWFADGNFTLINYTSDYTALSRSISRVNVFYEDMLYTVIEESPSMTLEVFVCYLGGVFGMFLGGSFLSLAIVMEMTYYLSLYVFRIYHAGHDMIHTKQLLKTAIAEEKWNKTFGDSNQIEENRHKETLGPSISPLASPTDDSRSSTPEVILDSMPTEQVKIAAFYLFNEVPSFEHKVATNKDDQSSFAAYERRTPTKPQLRRMSTIEESASPQLIVERIPSHVRSASTNVSLAHELSHIENQDLEEEPKPTLDDLTSFAVFEKRTVDQTRPKLKLTSLDSVKKRYNNIEPLWPGFKLN